MPKKNAVGEGPFAVLDQMYQKYLGELTPHIQLLLRVFFLILAAIAGGALLLGIGLLAF